MKICDHAKALNAFTKRDENMYMFSDILYNAGTTMLNVLGGKVTENTATLPAETLFSDAKKETT
jgi:hypothetical protein